VNSRDFWRAAIVQALLVAALFGVLLVLPLPHDFFKDWGIVVGPLSWILCSLATGRVLGLPLSLTAFAAAAGGVAGTLVGLAASHYASLPIAVAVFAASCAGYDNEHADKERV
jgi:hypothetical protein